jgi:uncharacterized repeat protein (TIGR03843 family)
MRDGELEVVGRLVASSNFALYCTITRRCPDPEPDLVATCVYKPVRGERPLDDFPDGTLARREVAAHALSEATGWGIVPPTVLRDGPAGEGMVQLWIDTDEGVDPWELVQRSDPSLRPMAVFDAIVNNADRKVGHILPADGHLYGVDHGICFSDEPKLRTVLWGWRGRRLGAEELAVVERIRDGLDAALGERLRELLAPAEVRATVERVDELLRTKRFPRPDPDRPAIPWPPF